MNPLLVIHSSGRTTRSITRRLTRRFSDLWQAQTGGPVIERDLTASTPPVVNENWIAAAFRNPADRTASDREALRTSDALIEELESAAAVVIGAPLYNFGMPAQLKAYIDQIVLVGRTFALDPSGPVPYYGLLKAKPVVVITSAGDGALLGDGAEARLNFLEPHLNQVLGFIGLGAPTWVRVGYEEFGDDRLKHSLAAAETAVDTLARQLAENVFAASPLAATASEHSSQ
jgi:FMN-dependent NADH-azoreductase